MAKLPVFTTERLILREVTEADVPAYEINFVDYEVISQLVPRFPGLIRRVVFLILFDIKLFRARGTIGGYGEFY
jgi:hypothetical protein